MASALWGLSTAQALTLDEAKGMAVGDSDARVEAISKAVAKGSEKTAAYLQALADDVVKMAGDRVIVVRDGQGLDPVTGQAVPLPCLRKLWRLRKTPQCKAWCAKPAQRPC